MRLEALAVEMPWVGLHPNRVAFSGVLTQVDAPSQRPPAGARGHRVFLTRQAAEAALPSLIGMALDHTSAMDGHDARLKVGIITSAEILDCDLVIEGYLFARDFPDVMAKIASGREPLGLSYELADARVEDVRAEIWTLTDVTFTGAAILQRNKAAYEKTSIKISREPSVRKLHAGESTAMDKQQTQQLIIMSQRMAEAAEAMGATINRLEAQQEDLSMKVERIVAAVDEENQLRERIAELEQLNTELKQKLEAAADTFRAKSESAGSSGRKTIPPLIGALLAKNGIELSDGMDTAALDASLAALSIEQRIAVKAQMAKAGLIV